MGKPKHDTRESWLNNAMVALNKEFFAANGHELPKKMRMSCGFPKAAGHRAIGQCFDTPVSADETYEMFICPTQAEPVRVLDIALHEMIHACVGIEAGHKGPFRKMAKEFGLAGKMTATVAEEGSELHKRLSRIARSLGKYPHAAMKPKRMPKKPNPWVRYVSPQEETFKVVVNENRVEEFGPPRDPWGNEMEPVNG